MQHQIKWPRRGERNRKPHPALFWVHAIGMLVLLLTVNWTGLARAQTCSTTPQTLTLANVTRVATSTEIKADLMLGTTKVADVSLMLPSGTFAPNTTQALIGNNQLTFSSFSGGIVPATYAWTITPVGNAVISDGAINFTGVSNLVGPANTYNNYGNFSVNGNAKLEDVTIVSDTVNVPGIGPGGTALATDFIKDVRTAIPPGTGQDYEPGQILPFNTSIYTNALSSQKSTHPSFTAVPAFVLAYNLAPINAANPATMSFNKLNTGTDQTFAYEKHNLSFSLQGCVPQPPKLSLVKQLPGGRSTSTDQFRLEISGAGSTAASIVTTTGTGNTATGTATLSAGTAGSTYTLSETGAGTPAANLSNYITTYQCTNAATNGQTPSGNGASFLITPVLDDDLACTFINTRRLAANLSVTKTNTPGFNNELDQAADTLLSGNTTTYTITVTNGGPDAAHGSILSDAWPTSLNCTTATCNPANGAACPTQTDAALATALQGTGAVIPTLPNGGSITIVLSCTVQ